MDQITPFYFGGDRMYVSTISSLIEDPLQISIEAGEYTMKPYFGGFVYTKTTYEPQFKDIVKVLNLRDGDPGLRGTYHDGFTNNKAVIRLVNDYFISYIDKERYDEDYYDEYCEEEEESEEEGSDKEYVVGEEEEDDDVDDDYVEGNELEEVKDEIEEVKDEAETRQDRSYKLDDNKSEAANADKEEKVVDWLHYLHLCAPTPPKKPFKVSHLSDYNNFPVLFFLNTKAVAENLSLEKEYEDEHKLAVWNVIDCNKGKIGVAIGQKEFHNMMGDQMGLAAFSVDGTAAVAFANFEYYTNVPQSIYDSEVFYPTYETTLQYNPDNVPWNRTKKNMIKEVENQTQPNK